VIQTRQWIVSARFDLLVLMAPAWLAIAVAIWLPESTPLSPWMWLCAVVGIDVSHVYASLFRTYFDGPELARRPGLYWGTPVACLIVLVMVNTLAPALLWTGMAYLAVLHFIRQQWGFSAIYRLNAGLPGRGWSARLEKWSIYGVTGFPVLWWHVHLPRDFAWFVEGDFIVGMPPAVLWPAGVATALVFLGHIVMRVRSRRAAPGRDLWLLTTAAAWFVGIVFTNGDLPFTFTNVVLHGVPYMALVALVCHRRWMQTGTGVLRRSLFSGRGLLVFVGALWVFAWVEEGLWDVLMWNAHPMFFGTFSTASWVPALAVPLLALPQLTHYILDGFIWRLDGSNPGLRPLLNQAASRSAIS
jgi:hypothetical protein